MSNAVFGSGGIPDRPENSTWTGLLRWMLAVMDDDDKALPFIASCLSYCTKNGGLTERQAASCSKALTRITDRWSAMTLDCQAEEIDPDESTEGLIHVAPKGSC